MARTRRVLSVPSSSSKAGHSRRRCCVDLMINFVSCSVLHAFRYPVELFFLDRTFLVFRRDIYGLK